MARRVFFSFHYQLDIVRASQVRNSWVTQDRRTAGFWDAAAWEEIRRGGDATVKKWIEGELVGTSVTVVLIGSQTSKRRYVRHEIQRSHALGKGLVGVRIHKLKDFQGHTTLKGSDPFNEFHYQDSGRGVYLSQVYRTYDYVDDDGYRNLNRWIEEAAAAAGR